jgi:hypothetical protein
MSDERRDHLATGPAEPAEPCESAATTTVNSALSAKPNAECEHTAEGGGATQEAADTASGEPSTLRRPDRSGILVGGALIAACGALVVYGVLDTTVGNDNGKGHHHTIPTAPVTYEVSGTGIADLTYQARNQAGKATIVHHAHLPWHTTVDVPVGQDPTISIVLGKNGGHARCTLAIRSHHVQSATATGAFGRATCSGVLPTPRTELNPGL